VVRIADSVPACNGTASHHDGPPASRPPWKSAAYHPQAGQVWLQSPGPLHAIDSQRNPVMTSSVQESPDFQQRTHSLEKPGQHDGHVRQRGSTMTCDSVNKRAAPP
jgi:hypothetical protein